MNNNNGYRDNNYQRNNRGGGGQRNNNGNKEKEQKNRLKEKELGLKAAKVAAFQKGFEEQVKSLDRHELVLKELIPAGYVQKVACGRTATLPEAGKMLIAINSYFSKIGLSVSGNQPKDVVSFLGDYQVWRDKKMAEYKEKLEKNILIHTTTVEAE